MKLDGPGSVRATVALVLLCATATAGCLDDGPRRHRRDSEIVFGLHQKTLDDGRVTTTVGYEFLDILDRGWSVQAHLERDRSCFVESLDRRSGKPHVEGGVALFRGGLLPSEGVAVVANRDDLVVDGPGWQGAGDVLTFEAQGFVMPTIERVSFRAPSAELHVDAPPAADEVALPIDGLEVRWAAGGGSARERVAVTFSAAAVAGGERGVELRCFFERTDGNGSLPPSVVARFAELAGPGEVRGTMEIMTHQQLTILADGGWIVYVVASASQRAQPFVLRR